MSTSPLPVGARAITRSLRPSTAPISKLCRLIAAAALLCVLAACASPGTVPTDTTPTPSAAPSATAPSTPAAPAAGERSAAELAGPVGDTETATVTRVVDGDTIHVEFADGRTGSVRYIGIDTPETVHPSKPVQPYGPEASAANHELVSGQTVTLETDISDTDRYDRALRYVWIGDDGDWLLVNAELLRRGLAVVSTYPPDVRWIDPIYLEAQQQAASAGRGIWSDQTPPPAPSNSVSPTISNSPASSTAPGTPGADCHPEYGVCLPLESDVNCGDLADRNFASTGNDPYDLDGNGDGVACEG